MVRYVSVDDCGPAINPMLIEGQVHGGIVHAIGQALYEQVVYDEDGQLVTGTFVDYALPTAAELPSFETDRTETPSPVNSLGVKGVGEAGTIAATPAVTAAVLDALAPLGVTELDMPLTPMRVWQAIQAAGKEVPHDHRSLRLRGARLARGGHPASSTRTARTRSCWRRPFAAAADEAAPGGADACSSTSGGSRGSTASSRRTAAGRSAR